MQITQETMEIVDNVCRAISKNFAFDHFEPDDIYQEAFIICMEILDKYDGDRPLENFLRVSLKNRLRNFRRDNSKYYKYQCEVCNNEDIENCENCLRQRVIYSTKKNIDRPKNIDEVKNEVVYESSEVELLLRKEIFDLVSKNIPVHMRTDYLKMMSDVYVNKVRREEVIERIRDILRQNDCLDE